MPSTHLCKSTSPSNDDPVDIEARAIFCAENSGKCSFEEIEQLTRGEWRSTVDLSRILSPQQLGVSHQYPFLTYSMNC